MDFNRSEPASTNCLLGSVGTLSNIFVTLSAKVGQVLSGAEHRAIGLSIAASVPAAFVAGAVVNRMITEPPWAAACAGLAGFGLVYGVLTVAFGHPDGRGMLKTWRRTMEGDDGG